MVRHGVGIAFLILLAAAARADDQSPGEKLVGKPAPVLKFPVYNLPRPRRPRRPPRQDGRHRFFRVRAI